MTFKPLHTGLFDELITASKYGRLVLLECADAATGEPRAVICEAVENANGKIDFFPFCHLPDTNPYNLYIPPLTQADVN